MLSCVYSLGVGDLNILSVVSKEDPFLFPIFLWVCALFAMPWSTVSPILICWGWRERESEWENTNESTIICINSKLGYWPGMLMVRQTGSTACMDARLYYKWHAYIYMSYESVIACLTTLVLGRIPSMLWFIVIFIDMRQKPLFERDRVK